MKQILLFILIVCAISSRGEINAQPNLTHVNNVNAAGNATLYWDVFTTVGSEEFVRNEIKVFDLTGIYLSPAPHLVGPNNDTGVLPTGWVMPSFIYNANDYAHCFTAVQITTMNGGTTDDVSPVSPSLCSIHLNASIGAGIDEVELEWNSPYAVSGDAAGGDFSLERLNEFTADWDVVMIIPDSPLGGTFTDNPGPCVSINIYRVRQVASNGVDMHVSNATDLVVGSVNSDLPVTTHVDVDPATGFAEVFFDYNVTSETLGYIIYKCSGAGSAEVLQLFDPLVSSALIPTSLASSGPESYRVSAFECINDDGTPNPNAAGECTTTIFTIASQLPCTNSAQISWNTPFGIEGGVDHYTIEMSLYDEALLNYGAWETLDDVGAGENNYLHEGANTESTYKYRVLAESTLGHVARSSVFELTFAYPETALAPVLKRASVMADGNVEIFIETDPTATEASFYQLEKFVEEDSVWLPILESAPSSLGFPITFVDTNVDTDSKSYTYRCTSSNSCDAETSSSNIGTTILLKGWRSMVEGDFENSLIWSEYLEFPEGVSTYELLRAPTRQSVSSPLSTLSSNTFFAEDYVGDLINEPGDFCYTILAVDNDMTNGMNGASSNTICLTEDPLVWIPDAFTPNLDQTNDWFPWNPGESTLGFISEISANNTSIYKLTILSRWGDVIFESESPDVCWDGTNENEMVPDGVYAVIAQVLDGAGKWHIISKSVQVIRP